MPWSQIFHEYQYNLTTAAEAAVGAFRILLDMPPQKRVKILAASCGNATHRFETTLIGYEWDEGTIIRRDTLVVGPDTPKEGIRIFNERVIRCNRIVFYFRLPNQNDVLESWLSYQIED